MAINKQDTRTLSIVDILRARRLAEAGTVLDTQIRCTSAEAGLNTALLSSIMPLTSRHTLLAKAGNQQVVGQFYQTEDGKIARLVYLAPNLTPDIKDDAWLLILDAMVHEAGKRGAHVLVGEVDEQTPLFETMRQSGFAVYARQTLWVYPEGRELWQPRVNVRQATEDDTGGIYALYRRTVPRILQQVTTPPSMNGFVYTLDDKIAGFINVAEGRDGVFFTPYLDPKVLPIADEILLAATYQVSRKRRLTVRVTRHQGWLGSPLVALGFECVAQQAVMVRHIAAGVQPSRFRSLEEKYASQAVKRQTGELPDICIEVKRVEHQTQTLMIQRDMEMEALQP